MRFLTISVILALVTYASVVPAKHIDLAKRSIVATNTIVKDGTTYYEVINAITSVQIATTTAIDTVTQTHTDVSYIYAYSGTDTSGIISRLQKGLSSIIDPSGATTLSSSDSSSPTPSSSAPSADSSSAPTDVIMIEALSSHNNYRARHHVGGVSWNQDLANHAKEVSQTCVFGHVVMPGTGQNIAMGQPSMEAAVDAWYNEEANYDYNTGTSSNGKEILHFTQVVWKNTTEIGCGATYCDNLQATFYVCDYRAPGNYPNQFTANVIRP